MGRGLSRPARPDRQPHLPTVGPVAAHANVRKTPDGRQNSHRPGPYLPVRSKEVHMKKARLTFLKLAVAAAIVTGVSVGSASAQSLQATFTLPYEVQWGQAVLQPGPYQITFDSVNAPAIARTPTGRGVALVRAHSA